MVVVVDKGEEGMVVVVDKGEEDMVVGHKLGVAEGSIFC
jgi:hypothetical protein